MDTVYLASPTLSKLHRSNKIVRGIRGPIGSGKSVGCCAEVMMKALNQKPGPDGVRRSRWAIIRNTYRELVDTTMETWFAWMPKDMGVFRAQDVKFSIDTKLPDGTQLSLEVLFRALDRPDDIKKLLSLELTGGWINEAREVPKAVLDMLIGRVGRYPAMKDGGPSWYGVIMDTNPPDTDHWWYRMFEEQCPDTWEGFSQPSGTSPDAENIANLPPGYYDNIMAGKDQEWINVYVHGRYGFVMQGKPVYVEYKDDVHFQEIDFTPDTTNTVYIGIDFGLTPAAVFGQKTASGRWIIFDELVTEDMGAVTFSALLKAHIAHNYPQCNFEIYGDPSGDIRAQTDETTPFEVLNNAGIVAWPTYTNDFIIRRESVAAPLKRLDFTGKPAFMLTRRCVILRKAMAGGYKYKRLQVSGQDKYNEKPDKNKYSHVGEALQYLLLGGGEDNSVIGGYGTTDIDYSLTNRMVI